MKKLLILSLLMANYTAIGQSVTIVPTNAQNTEFLKIMKPGVGLDHRSSDGVVGVGTFVNPVNAFIQTHTNHPLHFSTNNGSSKMMLAIDGNFGIGTTTPTRKLQVAGTGYFQGNLETAADLVADGLVLGGGSTIRKFIETLVVGQSIFGVVNNTCINTSYPVPGVDYGDAVILNIESSFSTLTVANVRASGLHQVEVKFCNIGSTNTTLLTGINMRFTVIK